MKIRHTVLAVLMVVSTLAATAQDKGNPLALSGMVVSFNAGEVVAGPIQAEIEKYTGSKLKLNFVPSEGYPDKLNIALASGSLPDFFVVTDIKNAAFVQAARAGAFWDITPFIKDYPNLASLPALGWKNSAIDGKNYGLYRVRLAIRAGFVWRQDWQQKLKLKTPETITDLTALLKAVAEADLDGNGKQDTIPLVMGYDKTTGINTYVSKLAVYLGGVNGWGVSGGKLVNEMFTDEYLKALDTLRDWYRNKYLDQEFMLSDRETTFNKVRSGKAGVFMGSTSDIDLMWEPVKALGGVLTLQNVFKSPSGTPVAGSEPGFNGIIAFNKATIKTEAQLRAVLTVFNKLNDVPMADLMNWGLQPAHSTETNGLMNRSQSQLDAYNRDVQPYRQFQYDPAILVTGRPGNKAPSTMLHNKTSAESVSAAVLDPTVPLISATWSQLSGTLNQLQVDAVTRYVMGDLDLAGFKKARDTWLSRGGQKVVDEYSLAYARK